MKHFDKPLRVNLNVLEQADPERNKKAITEGINIAILIFLGCAGLYIYSTITSPKEPRIHFSNITSNTALYSNTAKPSRPVFEKHLLIKGQQETGEELSFTLNSFDVNTKYRLDFGDGEATTVTGQNIFHTYDSPGKYQLQLVISNPDKPVQRISKKISID